MNKKITIALISISLYSILYSATVREMYELVRAATNDGQTNLAPSPLTTPYGRGTGGSQKILKTAQDLLGQLEAERGAVTTKVACDLTELRKVQRELEACKTARDAAQARITELEEMLQAALPEPVMETVVSGRVATQAKDQPLARIEKLRKERDDAQAALKAIVDQLQKTFGAIERAVLSR